MFTKAFFDKFEAKLFLTIMMETFLGDLYKVIFKNSKALLQSFFLKNFSITLFKKKNGANLTPAFLKPSQLHSNLKNQNDMPVKC
jgi:hypothetical protein